jgi:hypothetical protein
MEDKYDHLDLKVDLKTAFLHLHTFMHRVENCPDFHENGIPRQLRLSCQEAKKFIKKTSDYWKLNHPYVYEE